jgi:hypothetical protein
MNVSSSKEIQTCRCQELDAALRLWMAANDAKSHRIEQLEAECKQLRQRVSRLSRQVGRRGGQTGDQKVNSAR